MKTNLGCAARMVFRSLFIGTVTFGTANLAGGTADQPLRTIRDIKPPFEFAITTTPDGKPQPGDWSVRDEASTEARIRALEQLLAKDTGRKIRFVTADGS
ncbi:MAG: hypothetical protein GX448_09100 [Planctomycetes bacterium]|nr:hypothetical protein [Planctomycetota bacterium]